MFSADEAKPYYFLDPPFIQKVILIINYILIWQLSLDKKFAQSYFIKLNLWNEKWDQTLKLRLSLIESNLMMDH